GLWKLETPLPILREQKYVSSERELADYLVYEGLPGETVVVIEAEGRWKRVEVREGNRPGSAGWADAHRRRAEKL
ncbi:MAG TPA: hypothetical protein PK636_06245, partial [bacterium]|nr:hypothetical protein [bacterium]